MALSFGTGGVRELMGDGPDRINSGTIAELTGGVAAWLLSKNAAAARAQGVAVAYDTRNGSREFARVTAEGFAARGIPVYLFEEPAPTPMLSFAVRRIPCIGGVVVTASHNEKQYNGYKVYNHHGCQLSLSEAAEVIACQRKPAPGAGDAAPVKPVPEAVRQGFFAAVAKQSRVSAKEAKAALSVVYTPLFGTGAAYVPHALAADGFEKVRTVQAQMEPDGSFPGLKKPNPEDGEALTLGIALAQEGGADIVLGTDPDCDRVGAAVRHGGEYRLITGNQMGALLMDFIIKATPSLPRDGAVVKTIVTNDLGAALAEKAGLSVYETLTGFKFIGEKIDEFQAAGTPRYVFGYEESYGYLAGTHVRDKDAVVTSLLICEMTAWHKAAGNTLWDALEDIFTRNGVYRDALETMAVRSLQQVKPLMDGLRALAEDAFPGAEMIDYAQGVADLPRADVLKFVLPDKSWVAIRPSGTEPIVKTYYSALGKTRDEAEAKYQALRARMHENTRDFQ